MASSNSCAYFGKPESLMGDDIASFSVPDPLHSIKPEGCVSGPLSMIDSDSWVVAMLASTQSGNPSPILVLSTNKVLELSFSEAILVAPTCAGVCK